MKVKFRLPGIILMFLMIFSMIFYQVWLFYYVIAFSFIFYLLKLKKRYVIEKRKIKRKIDLLKWLFLEHCITKCKGNDYNDYFNCKKDCVKFKLSYMKEMKTNKLFIKKRFRNRK